MCLETMSRRTSTGSESVSYINQVRRSRLNLAFLETWSYVNTYGILFTEVERLDTMQGAVTCLTSSTFRKLSHGDVASILVPFILWRPFWSLIFFYHASQTSNQHVSRSSIPGLRRHLPYCSHHNLQRCLQIHRDALELLHARN